MAALDFPASPTVGQRYPDPSLPNTPQYTWDGEKWTTQLPTGGGGTAVGVSFTPTGNVAATNVQDAIVELDNEKVAKSGGVNAVMTGPLTLPGDPTTALQAATKQMVDGKAAIGHGHTASNITDFSEAVDDRVGALLVAGTNVTLNYNDAANALTINATGGGGTAVSTTFTPAGNIAATNVQAAIVELDTEKVGEAPNDALQYARKNLGWAEVVQNVYGNAHNYLFNAGTGAPAAAGSVRFNNVTQGSVTQIFMSYTTNDSIAINTKTYFLSRVKVGDVFYFQDKDDPNKWKIFTLNAAFTDNGTYATLPVTFVDGGNDITAARIVVSRDSPGAAASGDVTGPASAVADRVAVFNGTTGKIIKDGGKTIAELGGGGGTAATTTFTPAGNIAATDVQAALVEVDSEKVAKSGGANGVMTGNLTLPVTASSANNALNWGTAGTGINGDATTVAVSAGGALKFTFGATTHLSNVPIALPADPTNPLEAATKQYADTKAAAAHTHTAANITDFSEAVDDRVGALLVAGTNVTLNYNDAGNALTINSSGSGGGTAATTTFTPTGQVAATDVQAAIAEVDTEKAPKASPVFTGTVRGDDGAKATPAFSFSTEPSSGIYRKAANSISMSVLNTDIMTWSSTITQTIGNIEIKKAGAKLILNRNPAGSTASIIEGQRNDVVRWSMQLGDVQASETGSNTGSDFSISRYDDAGTYLGMPFTISRATGKILLEGPPTVPLGAATKAYVDSVVSGGAVPEAPNDSTAYVRKNLGWTAETTYTHPAGDGNLHVPATSTTNNLKVLKAGATAGSAAWGSVAWSEITSPPLTFPPAAHTHPASEITDFSEAVDDRVGALLVAGTNVTLNYNDAANSLTINSSGGGGTATTTTFTPAGNIAATNVQTAIQELDTEKVKIAGDTMTGVLQMPPGTAAAPSINFGTANIGLYGAGNFIAISSGGTVRATIGATELASNVPIWGPVGTAAAPAVSVGSNGLTGLYGQNNALNVGINGTLRFTFGNTTHTSTLPILLPADPTNLLEAATKQYVDSHSGSGGISEAPTDGQIYSRRGSTASWVVNGSAGTATGTTYAPTGNIAATNVQAAIDELDTEKAKLGGTNTFTDVQTISKGSGPSLTINGLNAQIKGQLGGNNRWHIGLGDGSSELGGDIGTNFVIHRYNDSAVLDGNPVFRILRSTGLATVLADPTNALGVATKQYVDARVNAGGILESPNDGVAYNRKTTGGVGAWVADTGGSAGTAVTTTFTPYSTIAATNVQAAIQELKDETLYVSGGTVQGDVGATGNMFAVNADFTGFLKVEGTSGLQVIPSSGAAVIDMRKNTGTQNEIQGKTNSSLRWKVILGDSTAEGGSGLGSNFKIERYNDGGTLNDTPLSIDRSTGFVSVAYDPNTALHVATKGYVDGKVGGLPLTGGTLTGNLTMGGTGQPRITFNKDASGKASEIYSTKGGLNRWVMQLGDQGAESGSNAGSDFVLYGHNDAGGYINSAITIKRSDGLVLLAGDPTVALHAATKQYADSKAVAPATVAPLINGTATVGTTTKYAREDHIHPTDTSRLAATQLNGGKITISASAPSSPATNDVWIDVS